MHCDEHPFNPLLWGQTPRLQRAPHLRVFDIQANAEFEQFVANLKKAGVETYVRIPVGDKSGCTTQEKESNNDANPKVFAMNVFSTGGTNGVAGGECSRPYTVPNKDIPLFGAFDAIVETFWPDMDTRKARALHGAVYASIEWNVNGYYGDSTDYRCETLDLEKVFAVLKHYNRLTPHFVVGAEKEIAQILKKANDEVELLPLEGHTHRFKVK